MENSTNMNSLPSWGIAILIVIFVIALIIACWGFLSGFNLKRKHSTTSSSIVWNELFVNKKAIKFDQTFNINKGIFALTFAKVEKNDFFLPIYIFETDDFKRESKELISKIIENEFETINNYMKENKKNLKDIFFVQLEEKTSDLKKEEWIKKTGSKNRGFNT
ncbi:unknown transmembrane protein [Mesoplasma florum L1]|uniref:Uncharacterized protein n=1 Tax=Mesoplasma florum (strain ATCC 33453 / NBRC 100688 / NCTC 11704 / L1) TaxID=265311 RepID=Q6F1Q4_MESFL|nr:hypothetical protein [Mesoplasma florum]AAT75569.1 unknown transmembrane protein [Mesoplasma florum L1]ATI73167.1 hypothetical protein CQZ69_01140 [Mesoplasma florum]AVN60891.1 hypothetical protein CG005_01115 [Mesoplasma florum]AVN61569.1 hypothetical protein CG004_01140 [Mesoplasma florum]